MSNVLCTVAVITNDWECMYDNVIRDCAPSQYINGLSGYWGFHVKDKTVARQSYL